MAGIYQSVTELIGRTPLLEVKNLEKELNLQARVLVKLEYFNPAGSVKDRAALQMITEAEENGTLKPGSAIIEPTSGNTGIGLASIAASRGYRAIFVMPETMSIERRKLLKGYGAEIVLTEGAKGMKGAIEKAKELEQEIENAVILGQFVNTANPRAHEKTTGPEIWEALVHMECDVPYKYLQILGYGYRQARVQVQEHLHESVHHIDCESADWLPVQLPYSCLCLRYRYAQLPVQLRRLECDRKQAPRKKKYGSI